MKLKFIGNGVQYFAYDLGNGKVLKKKTSFLKKMSIYKGWCPDISIFKSIRYAINSTIDTILAKRFVLKNPKLAKEIFGNPIYINNFFRKYDFIQDKLIPLDLFFKENGVKENKIILDKYINLVIETWKYGFFEKIFNFDRNCGVDGSGNVIMFDFGEIGFSKEENLQKIKEEYWLEKQAYNDLPENLKEYFRIKMKEFITEENLDKFWGICK